MRDCVAHSHADPIPHAYTDTHAVTYSKSHADSIADPHPVTDVDTDTVANLDAHSESYAFADTYGHVGPDGDGQTNCSIHTHVHQHAIADENPCAATHFNFHCDPGAIGFSDTHGLADGHSQAISSTDAYPASRH